MMQTDVKAKYINATGAAAISTNTRTRLKGIYFLNGASAGSIVITDGSSSGNQLFKCDTAAAATAASSMMPFPGEGILSMADPYVTLTNVTSITLFYG